MCFSGVNFYYGAPAPYAESIAPSHHSTYAHYYDDEEDGWDMPNFYGEGYNKVEKQTKIRKKSRKYQILRNPRNFPQFYLYIHVYFVRKPRWTRWHDPTRVFMETKKSFMTGFVGTRTTGRKVCLSLLNTFFYNTLISEKDIVSF